MDLLDRLLGHDAWTTRALLALCADLTDEQLDLEFDIGLRTLRATLAHVVRNEEAWTAAMVGDEVLAQDDDSIASLIRRHEAAAAALGRLAAQVRDRGVWDETWRDLGDGVERTYGGAIAHVITHSMHHRAQVLFMLRRLGVAGVPEGDVLSWERERSDAED